MIRQRLEGEASIQMIGIRRKVGAPPKPMWQCYPMFRELLKYNLTTIRG